MRRPEVSASNGLTTHAMMDGPLRHTPPARRQVGPAALSRPDPKPGPLRLTGRVTGERTLAAGCGRGPRPRRSVSASPAAFRDRSTVRPSPTALRPRRRPFRPASPRPLFPRQSPPAIIMGGPVFLQRRVDAVAVIRRGHVVRRSAGAILDEGETNGSPRIAPAERCRGEASCDKRNHGWPSFWPSFCLRRRVENHHRMQAAAMYSDIGSSEPIPKSFRYCIRLLVCPCIHSDKSILGTTTKTTTSKAGAMVPTSCQRRSHLVRSPFPFMIILTIWATYPLLLLTVYVGREILQLNQGALLAFHTSTCSLANQSFEISECPGRILK
jgi:hypothetical protein